MFRQLKRVELLFNGNEIYVDDVDLLQRIIGIVTLFDDFFCKDPQQIHKSSCHSPPYYSKSGTLQIIGSGENRISFINVSDAISAIESVIRNPLVQEGTFCFSAKAQTQKEVYGIVCHALGVPAPTKHTSKELAIRALQLRNAAFKLIGRKTSMTVENILTLADNREFDCRRAREAFGWEPKVKLSKESLKPYL